MEIIGEYRLDLPREQVWAAINDPDILRACIPGCEALESTSDTTMTAVVVQKIGPVKARFNGEVELISINAPASYTIQGEGKGGLAGFAKGSADIRLVEDGDGTVMTYEARVQIGGKLAQLGSRLIGTTAKKLANMFFENLRTHLSERERISDV